MTLIAKADLLVMKEKSNIWMDYKLKDYFSFHVILGA